MAKQLVDGMTKTKWVLAQSTDLSPKEVAELGRAAGFATLTNSQVSSIRHVAGLKPKRHGAKRGRPAAKPGPKPKSLALPPVRKPQQAFTQDEQAFMGLALRFGTERALELVDQAHQIAVNAVNAVPTRR